MENQEQSEHSQSQYQDEGNVESGKLDQILGSKQAEYD